MIKSARIFFCVCGVVAVLGFTLCFVLFSYLPLIWSAGLCSVFAVYVGVCVILRRNADLAMYFWIGCCFTIAFGVVIATFTGVERVEGFQCAWKPHDDGAEIDLRAVGGFGWSRVSSLELADHLSKNKPARVHVSLPITRDFGSLISCGSIKFVDGIPVREQY